MRCGVAVEAELGHVTGGEDVAAPTEGGALTEPEEAASFCASSGVGCLAVRIGNVHGPYAGSRRSTGSGSRRSRLGCAALAARRLRSRRRRPAPRNVAGIPKANVNAELRDAYFGALDECAAKHAEALDLRGLGEAVIGAVERVVEAKLDLLGWEPR